MCACPTCCWKLFGNDGKAVVKIIVVGIKFIIIMFKIFIGAVIIRLGKVSGNFFKSSSLVGTGIIVFSESELSSIEEELSRSSWIVEGR